MRRICWFSASVLAAVFLWVIAEWLRDMSAWSTELKQVPFDEPYDDSDRIVAGIVRMTPDQARRLGFI